MVPFNPSDLHDDEICLQTETEGCTEIVPEDLALIDYFRRLHDLKQKYPDDNDRAGEKLKYQLLICGRIEMERQPNEYIEDGSYPTKNQFQGSPQSNSCT